MEKKKKRSRIVYIFLAVMILCQLGLSVYFFAVEKTAQYEDEFFSYGLANSIDRPFLYGSKLYVCDNNDIYMTGDDFKYYIRTNKESAFSYVNVWKNQSADTLPPLYIAVLHTICSFFPDKFSWWWGYSINIVTFIVLQIFMFRIFSRLTSSKLCGALTCTFWGFTISCQNMLVFVRMYTMLTMFVMMFIWYSISVFDIGTEGRVKIKNLIPVCIATMLGALTHHLFLIYAFFFTALACILLFIKKRPLQSVQYGCAVLAGVLLSVAAFPATIPHLFGDNKVSWSHEISFSESFHFLNRSLIMELTGHNIGFWRSANYAYYVIALIALLVLIGCTIFIFRKDEWMKKSIRTTAGFVKNWACESDHLLLLIGLSAAAYHVMISFKFYYFDILDYIDRYIFFESALAAGCVVAFSFIFVRFIMSFIDKKRAGKQSVAMPVSVSVISAVIAAVLCFTNFRCGDLRIYNFKAAPVNGKVASYVEGKNCLVVSLSPVYLPCYCEMLQDADRIFVTTYKSIDLGTNKGSYSDLYSGPEEMYCLAMSSIRVPGEELSETDQKTQNDLTKNLESITGRKSVFVTQENTHGISVILYKLEAE